MKGYAPNSNSFSPPCINTQSRVNGSEPFNSHASSPLHSSQWSNQWDLSLSVSGRDSDSYHVNSNFSVHTTPPTRDYSSKPHPTSENSGARRKILSSSSPNPPKVGHSSPARRVRISEPSSHDDYISRLENLQQRLSGMDSDEESVADIM
ncbi:uncharacterized protein LOC128162331 [Crassostrea angulata]|uniref:uncharacterized protein LOC128162331 n=1 Tax=Magallana angulata TaxID=2784310 RepID=UPI0022B128B4|nr:uncharacterized protein LOC128162331 [Crassostrea angulata]